MLTRDMTDRQTDMINTQTVVYAIWTKL